VGSQGSEVAEAEHWEREREREGGRERGREREREREGGGKRVVVFV